MKLKIKTKKKKVGKSRLLYGFVHDNFVQCSPTRSI